MEKGYYRFTTKIKTAMTEVAIHNKNGKGLLQKPKTHQQPAAVGSQSTIKMEKGYYVTTGQLWVYKKIVAIHNKNGKGLLLQFLCLHALRLQKSRNPQ